MIGMNTGDVATAKYNEASYKKKTIKITLMKPRPQVGYRYLFAERGGQLPALLFPAFDGSDAMALSPA